ncbi:WD40 repeat-like protein [Marasmius fiardii PR-910]|nr:WD40 repeat-like protein [Marasmius fiardii PR-910]
MTHSPGPAEDSVGVCNVLAGYSTIMATLNVDDELVNVPIITIQPTFTNVVKEVWSGFIPSEEIWLSRYRQGSESVHDRIRVALDEDDRDKVIWESTSSGQGKLSYDDKSGGYSVDSVQLLVPIQHYRLDESGSHRITSLAISQDVSQFSVGLLDGSIFLFPIVPPRTPPKYPEPENPEVLERRQTLIEAHGKKTAHKSTVTSLQFFPSSRVLLSAGADFTMRIWPAEPFSTPSSTSQSIPSPLPARTLTAHTRPILSIAINPHDRGKTVFSGSADGTIRTWNVSSGSEVVDQRVRHGGSGISAMNLDTDASRIYCALQDGSFEVFTVNLPSPGQNAPMHTPSQRIFKSPRSVGGALTSIAASPGSDSRPRVLATGTANGIVSIYLIDEDFPHLLSFRRNGANIEALSFLPDPISTHSLGLAIATSDGLPWIASISLDPDLAKKSATVKPYAELTGGEIDSVRDIVATGKEVWTVCDDGLVKRLFKPNNQQHPHQPRLHSGISGSIGVHCLVFIEASTELLALYVEVDCFPLVETSI